MRCCLTGILILIGIFLLGCVLIYAVVEPFVDPGELGKAIQKNNAAPAQRGTVRTVVTRGGVVKIRIIKRGE